MSHIRDLRVKRGINQSYFGTLFGISQQTVSRIEKNPQTIGVDILIRVSEYYNVTTDYILELTDEKRNLLMESRVNKKIDDYYDFIIEFEELSQTHQQVLLSVLRGLKEAQSSQK